MLPDMDDRGELGEIAAKIIAMLTQPYSLDEGRCVIGASVGIAVAPHDGVSREEVVHSADLEGDLQQAVRDDQLFLTYQPVVSTETQKVVGLEAQICWNHPQRGEIDNAEFQSIVENSALVV